MTNKEAAEVLKRIRDGLDEMGELNDKSREAFDAALAALEAERWIPCEKRLPEKEGEYIVTTRWDENGDFRVTTLEYGFKVVDRWKDSDRVFPNGAAFGEEWADGMDNIEETIAWMPLPERYREEGE